MTRRPFLLAASLAISAAAVVACGSDDDPGADADGQSEGTIACEDGTVGQAGRPAETDVRITEYDAQLTIATGGGLTAAETITVQFDDSEHHGIFRNFSGEDYVVSDVTGTVDGAPSGSYAAEGVGGRLTLGDADVTLPAGEHDFGVSYSASAVLEPATDVDQDLQFDAAVLSPDWALDIADATVTIALPSESGDVSCVAGPGATASIAGGGTSTLVVTADEVPVGSGVRVLVGVDSDADE